MTLLGVLCNFDLSWSFKHFWKQIFVFSAVQGLPKTIFEVIKWWREEFRLNKADKNVIYPNAVQITIWLRTKTEFSLELPLIKLNFSNFQLNKSLCVDQKKKFQWKSLRDTYTVLHFSATNEIPWTYGNGKFYISSDSINCMISFVNFQP